MERLGRILSRVFASQGLGLCKVCWCRQSLTMGARCMDCGGVIHRVGR